MELSLQSCFYVTADLCVVVYQETLSVMLCRRKNVKICTDRELNTRSSCDVENVFVTSTIVHGFRGGMLLSHIRIHEIICTLSRCDITILICNHVSLGGEISSSAPNPIFTVISKKQSNSQTS